MILMLLLSVSFVSAAPSASGTDGVVCESRSLITTIPVAESSRDLIIEGEWMYSMSLAGTLEIYRVSNPATPLLTGTLSHSTEGLFVEMQILNDYIYIVDNYEGVHVVDVRNKFAPRLVTTYRDGSVAQTITIEGSTLYAVVGGGDLQIVDITDTENPTRIIHMDTRVATGIAVHDGYAFLTERFGRMRSYDVRDPYAPVQVGFTQTPHENERIIIENDLAYLSHGPEGITVYDISDPGQLIMVRHVGDTDDQDPGELGSVSRFFVTGGRVFIPSPALGFRVLDLSHSVSYSLSGFHAQATGADYVSVVGSTAYVSGWDNSLSVYDITNPVSTPILGEYDPSRTTRKVSIYGNTAYLANGEGGVKILNISDPSSPTEIGAFDTPSEAEHLIIENGYAYIADGGQFLEIYQASKNNSFLHVASAKIAGSCLRVRIQGDLAHVAGDGGLHLIDVSDPLNPLWPSSFDTDGNARDVQIKGNTAYVVTTTGKLEIIGINDPAIPYRISQSSFGGYGVALALLDDYALIASRNNGLFVMDISDPASPQVAAHYPLEGVNMRDMSIVGDRAYIAEEEDGMGVYDISDLLNIQVIGQFKRPKSAQHITATDGVAFLSDYRGSLYTLDITESCRDCLADLNHDNTLNFFDVTLFIEAYIAEDASADLNNDGLLNFYDVSRFLQAFSAGCS